MVKKMLIDASHAEETRVVITNGDRVEDFDFESASRRPVRGNIYLAKVTSVEPSLQAAFVDYGAGRHGFLPLSEIHPDYYQIPVSDREALLREQEEEERAAIGENGDEVNNNGDEGDEDIPGEDDDVDTKVRKIRQRLVGRYKIQEVIKRRQILLVQVAKEERGTKGAALTTYLSLAGRYCVVMPNSARGGGVSRKITSATDRKKLKSIVASLNVPPGLSVIVRTAGAKRTKAEIKRDYEHLLRLWERIRTLTLESTAPALVYEEGTLVRRAIRDLYDKSIDMVLVEGEQAYREAKDFMKLMMPSHAKNVQPYRDDTPLFLRHQVESQLDTITAPRVDLKSGGYIIINPTEALVSIDVNSGRSTRERNVEQTALKTNLEAAEEIARQARLRDLAGLIVIDFIDMEDSRNNRAVERKLKDALKLDRARLQVGKISNFGLLEMSRQRRRSNVLEGTTETCQHCKGTGLVSSPSSAGLHVLRAVEEEAVKGRASVIRARTATPVALYVLNQKRDQLQSIESRYDVTISIEADATLANRECDIEIAKEGGRAEREGQAITQAEVFSGSAEDVEATEAESGGEEASKKPKRRRRRSEAEPEKVEAAGTAEATSEETSEESAAAGEATEEASGESKPKRRRRGRRGGRNRRREGDATQSSAQEAATTDETGDPDSEPASASPVVKTDAPEAAAKPAASQAGEADKPAENAVESAQKPPQTAQATEDTAGASKEADKESAKADEDGEKPKRRRRRRTPAKAVQETAAETASATSAGEAGPAKPQESGDSAESEAGAPLLAAHDGPPPALRSSADAATAAPARTESAKAANPTGDEVPAHTTSEAPSPARAEVTTEKSVSDTGTGAATPEPPASESIDVDAGPLVTETDDGKLGASGPGVGGPGDRGPGDRGVGDEALTASSSNGNGRSADETRVDVADEDTDTQETGSHGDGAQPAFLGGHDFATRDTESENNKGKTGRKGWWQRAFGR